MQNYNFAFVVYGCENWSLTLGVNFNPLKPELNPICYLLALLGAHHFLHVGRIRVSHPYFSILSVYKNSIKVKLCFPCTSHEQI